MSAESNNYNFSFTDQRMRAATLVCGEANKNSDSSKEIQPDCWSSRSEVIKILLIRHAETIDNVRHNYAGTTDSALTNHGVLQAQALASSLVAEGFYITHIAASTSQRASQTARAIRSSAREGFAYEEQWDLAVTLDDRLREQDFGSLEGKSYTDTPPLSKRPKLTTSFFHGKAPEPATSEPVDRKQEAGVESHGSVARRAQSFIDSYLIPIITGPREPTSPPLIIKDPADCPSSQHVKTIAIVSHGIFLHVCFRELLARFHTVTATSEAAEAGFELGRTPRWDNTGYTVLRLHSPVYTVEARTGLPPSPIPTEHLPTSKVTAQRKSSGNRQLEHKLIVNSVNVKRHLTGLKRTGGGIGSSRADPRQRTMKDFFKTKTVAADHASTTIAVSKDKHELFEDGPWHPWALLPPPTSSPFDPTYNCGIDAPSSEFYPSSPPPDDPAGSATISSFLL